MKTKNDRYSTQELSELQEIHCELVRTEVFNYAEGGSLWRRLHGIVADTPVSPLLRMTDDALGMHDPGLSSESQRYLLTKIGAHMVFPIRDNNAEFFDLLAVVLRARRKNRPLTSLTANELGLRRAKGRKATPLDLSRAFPLALLNVTMNRSSDHAPKGKFTDKKVTRTELLKAIQHEQMMSGLTSPPPISESELSRWIAKHDFGRFMAEQPIARKSPKHP
jgi:hypothetical protein